MQTKLNFWLLVSYISYCIVKSPEYPDSIIAVALASLLGLEVYLDSRKVPKRDSEIVELEKNLKKEMLSKELLEVKTRTKNIELAAIRGDKRVQF